MAEINAQNWCKDVIYSCNFHDAPKAASALREWDKMIGQLSEPQKNEVLELKKKLLFTAFPELPLKQASEVIEKNFLDILVSEVDAEEIMNKRFLALGYGGEEPDRETLRSAALKNQQQLGDKTISQWLQSFEKMFSSPELSETENAAGEFFRREPTIASLKKNDQILLRSLLQTYDQWLREPLISIFDAVVVHQKLQELEQTGVRTINVNTFKRDYLDAGSEGQRTNVYQGTSQQKDRSEAPISLPLLPAISKYNQLAQQPITREKIRVRSQVEPVRPTLMNWLKYYRSELGIGYHDSVQRGEFLYRSENGRRLSDEERERLSLILKSIEEEYPLQIDTVRSEIVFPEQNRTTQVSGTKRLNRSPVLPAQSFQPPVRPELKRPSPLEIPVAKPLSFHQGGLPRSYAARESERPVDTWKTPQIQKTEQPLPKPAFKEMLEIQGMKPAPAWKISAPQVSPQNLTFSSPHVFPAERERRENWQRQKAAARPLDESSPTPQTYEKKFTPPKPAPPAPPSAPRRPTALPRPQPQAVPNRFNITPMSYREEEEL